MAKRAKEKLVNTKYVVNGNEVDINQYLAPKSPLPRIPDACKKYATMSFDDVANIMPHERINIVNEYSKPTFESTLNKEQIAILLPVLNRYIFAEELREEDMEAWLQCTSQSLQIKNNRYFAYLLSKMASNGMICSNWAKVAEVNGLFKSRNGILITSTNLTTSLERFGSFVDKEDSKRIAAIKTSIDNAVKSAKG